MQYEVVEKYGKVVLHRRILLHLDNGSELDQETRAGFFPRADQTTDDNLEVQAQSEIDVGLDIETQRLEVHADICQDVGIQVHKDVSEVELNLGNDVSKDFRIRVRAAGMPAVAVDRIADGGLDTRVHVDLDGCIHLGVDNGWKGKKKMRNLVNQIESIFSKKKKKSWFSKYL